LLAMVFRHSTRSGVSTLEILRRKEDLVCVWIFHFASREKTCDVENASEGS